MKLPRWHEWIFKVTDDPLAPYRRRAMQRFAFVGILFLFPFALDNFWHERYVVGIASLVFVLLLVIDGIAVRRQRPPPIPYGLALIPAMTAIGVSLATAGVIGVFWCYPLVLFCYYAMPRRLATLCSVAVLIVTSLLVLGFAGQALMLRVAATLSVTIIVVNTILGIILDLQHKLLDQAITDPLTGALNRRRLDAVLEQAIERNRRKPTPASLLLIDLDHFKRVNDELGHAVGDRVLKDLVALMTERTRKFDSLFRIGGEEFLLLLTETPESAAVDVAEHLRSTIAEAALVPQIRLTISVGVSELQQDDSAQTWIRRVDEALYAAKRGGRNRVVSAGASSVATLSATGKVRDGAG
jgi:diguanylate cyclase (GGDEF)-like protein